MRSPASTSWSAPAGSARPTTTAPAARRRRCSASAWPRTPASLDGIRARFASRQMAMPEINRRQALVPDGASVLANTGGTAPGLWIPTARGALLLMPGPPREMRPMLQEALQRHVVPRWGVTPARQRQLVVAGRSESWVDERLQPIYAPWAAETPPIATTILASLGIIEVHLSAAGDDARGDRSAAGRRRGRARRRRSATTW